MPVMRQQWEERAVHGATAVVDIAYRQQVRGDLCDVSLLVLPQSVENTRAFPTS